MRPQIGLKKIRSDKRKRLANGLLSNEYMSAKWDGKPKRAPMKGEFFISGCGGFEVAYEAKAHIVMEYYIAVLCEE